MSKQHVASAGIVVLLALAAVMGCQMWRILGNVNQNVLALQKQITQELRRQIVQTFTETVTRQSGGTGTVSTVRNTNADGTPESLDSWQQRHDEAVAQFKNS